MRLTYSQETTSQSKSTPYPVNFVGHCLFSLFLKASFAVTRSWESYCSRQMLSCAVWAFTKIDIRKRKWISFVQVRDIAWGKGAKYCCHRNRLFYTQFAVSHGVCSGKSRFCSPVRHTTPCSLWICLQYSLCWDHWPHMVIQLARSMCNYCLHHMTSHWCVLDNGLFTYPQYGTVHAWDYDLYLVKYKKVYSQVLRPLVAPASECLRGLVTRGRSLTPSIWITSCKAVCNIPTSSPWTREVLEILREYFLPPLSIFCFINTTRSHRPSPCIRG